MRRATLSILFVALCATVSPAMQAAPSSPDTSVEFELMTWPEVRDALAAGKTTALIYTGGVEQRGPQNANGGHNLMARAIVKEIALKLGNAIAMPVLPFSPNSASAQFPGTIGLTNELLDQLLERMVEESIATGFKNVVVMGDHGGGQGEGAANVYRNVATRLNEKFQSQGKRVFYCDQVYMPANLAFGEYLAAKGYPPGARLGHGNLVDTSIMMYLDEQGTYVRKQLIANAVGRSLGPDGRIEPATDPKFDNGIVGDARGSSAELGKLAFDMKVDYAVKQIREFIPQVKE